MALSRLHIAIKALHQLGLTQVTLYVLYKVGLKTGYFRWLADNKRQTTDIGSLSTVQNLFTLPDHDQLAKTLGKDGQRALLAEADEIVDGNFRMFGGKPVPIRLSFNKSLSHWTDYETNPQLLTALYSPTLRPRPVPLYRGGQAQGSVSDIKFIWEPARFGWAFTLGRAYHLTKNETYAEAFWKYFDVFTESNPPNMGPHWMNGQEVAIRLMALVWANQVFETAAASSAERRARLAQSVAAHAARIPPTLIYARAQNNNHLISEAAGLYTAARALPDHSQAGKWRRLGLKWLHWCFAHQIDDTGEYIQHSTNYHRLMLQAALWIASFVDEASRFTRNEKLTSATRWLAALTDPISGQAVNLGANDGAYIFPLSNGDFRDFRPVVQAASRLFLGAGAFECGAWDEMSLWFGRADSKLQDEAVEIISKYPVIRSDDSWGMLRAAGGNLRLAHADLLHVDLWWRGLNIALDPGTYLYNGEPPWDNPWPATRFHNTVTINQADQMTRAGRFLYLDWARVDWGYSADFNRGLQEVHASHTGYHKFGLWHHRTLIQVENHWEVLDSIYPSGEKTVAPFSARLHWLLPDWDWNIENQDSGFEIRVKSPYGWIALHVEVDPQFSNSDARTTLIRAGELVYGEGQVSPVQGWFSSTYGYKVPALALAIETRNISKAGFLSKFIFPP